MLKRRIVMKRPPFTLFMQEIIKVFDETKLKLKRQETGYKTQTQSATTQNNLRKRLVNFKLFYQLDADTYAKRQMETLGGLAKNVSYIIF